MTASVTAAGDRAIALGYEVVAQLTLTMLSIPSIDGVGHSLRRYVNRLLPPA